MIPSVSFKRRRQSGIAIILVLSILVLLTAVVIAFFTNATTDLTVSKSYSDEARVKLLAHAALNVVEGQIRAATAGGSAGTPVAWASQPGLIRTYGTLTGGTMPTTTFKLYSSDVMQVTGTFNPTATATEAEEIPDGVNYGTMAWNKLPSDFVDLNSPEVVPDPDGTITDPVTRQTYSARFPIIDGNNLAAPSGGTALTYLDQNNAPSIEGFSTQPQPTTICDTSKIIAANNNPVPMPVRWLYELQNGELNPRDPTTHVIQDASAKNPVVGRIAFWTDDDTCKLNVNTASEGNFWDRPWCSTPTEIGYSRYLPAQNEFQMFPGHPAKTCLSTVFGDSLLSQSQPAGAQSSSVLFGGWPIPGYTNTSVGTGIFVPAFLTSLSSYNQLLPYYDLVPRVTSGATQGSAGGTQTVPAAATNGIVYDADRLYDSVDELIFDTAVSGTSGTTTRSTRNVAGNVPGGIPVLPHFLETARFFLTTSNRAPEVTLLNTPRVALWPEQVTSGYRTAKEQLLAFCSTIPSGSSNAYYFQRYNAASAGGPPYSCESPTLDWSLVPRNPLLYTYLQNLLKADVPGLGGNFATKYPATYNQILTEMVDEIRSGVNTWSTNASGKLVPSYPDARGNSGEGQVVPLIPPAGAAGAGTQGFGRFSTITEVALDLFRVNQSSTSAPTTPIQIGAVLILQPFSPSPGYPPWSPNMQVQISGLEGFTIHKTGDPNPPVSLGLASGVNIADGVVGNYATGGVTEFNTVATMFVGGGGKKTLRSGSGDGIYPFFNTPATTAASSSGMVGTGQLPSDASTFDLNVGGPVQVTIQIYSNPTIAQRILLQTLVMKFPPSLSIPVPAYSASGTRGNTTVPTIFGARILAVDNQPNDPTSQKPGIGFGMIDPLDVVRSMVVDPTGPSKGDYRVIAGLQNVPYNYFAAHPFYDMTQIGTKSYPTLDPNPGAATTNWRFAESLRAGDDPGWGGMGFYTYSSPASPTYLATGGSGVLRKSALVGSLIPPTSQSQLGYAPQAAPAVPPLTPGAYLTAADGKTAAPGDWDTGFGTLEDGPYINKPDEGDSATATANASGSVYFDRYLGNIENGKTYSPNREMASAVAFGSLPTGIDPTGTTIRPWQTLLFCPNPAAQLLHPGFGVSAAGAPNVASGVPAPPYTSIPDHYILDLFTMPIVEPYAISEPLSSQGKVNMNYQIAPFIYIRRDTAVQAVLKSTRLTAIPSSATMLAGYKSTSAGLKTQIRYAINPDEKTGTLKGFEDRFSGGDMFRSASEICSIPLVPAIDSTQNYDPTIGSAGTPTYSSMPSFWAINQLTGDNAREEPYGDLYPRLTTKSNSYTVHVRVQTLKKSSITSADTFIDPTDTSTPGAKDLVTAEYRGSYQIERYVDPNATNFPDYVTVGLNSTPIGTFYKFHTIGAKQF